MADHNDLFAAALNAVNAVEARSAAKSADNTLPPPSPDLNAEGVDELEDDLDFHLSVSAFNRLLDEPIGEEDDENLICVDSDIPEQPETDTPANIAPPEPPKAAPFIAKPAPQVALNKPAPFVAKPTIPSIQKVSPQPSTPTEPTKEPAPAPQPQEASLATDNAELASLREELKKANERIVRLTADFDNYRKRVARDQDQMKNQAEERIVSSFLGVMDNFERAIAHAKQSKDYDQLLQGVELTSKQYLSTLAKHGCVPFDSMGKEFDPNFHDVLQRTIDPNVPHNSVVQEHLKGYMMHDHVIRPALVVVAQHSEDEDSVDVNL